MSGNNDLSKIYEIIDDLEEIKDSKNLKSKFLIMLACARMVTEQIVRNIYNANIEEIKNDEDDEFENFNYVKSFEKIESKIKLQEGVSIAFRTIRYEGNKAIHNLDFHEDVANANVNKHLKEIINWYEKNFEIGGKLKNNKIDKTENKPNVPVVDDKQLEENKSVDKKPYYRGFLDKKKKVVKCDNGDKLEYNNDREVELLKHGDEVFVKFNLAEEEIDIIKCIGKVDRFWDDERIIGKKHGAIKTKKDEFYFHNKHENHISNDNMERIQRGTEVIFFIRENPEKDKSKKDFAVEIEPLDNFFK